MSTLMGCLRIRRRWCWPFFCIRDSASTFIFKFKDLRDTENIYLLTRLQGRTALMSPTDPARPSKNAATEHEYSVAVQSMYILTETFDRSG